MNKITFDELSEYMEAISDSCAFELAAMGDSYVVPYIMNDSIEDYFVFKGCSIRGEYDPELQEDTVVEAVRDGELTGLIIRQKDTNVVTLITKDGKTELPLMSKIDVAMKILDKTVNH